MTRTRALFAALLAAVLGTSGCGKSPAEPVDPPPSGSPPPADFSAQIQVAGQTLHITYRFANRSDRELVVLNGNAVYITGRPGTHTVEVAKRAFAMPADAKKTWTAPFTVAGATVQAGRTVTEQLTVPLPLTRHHPYGDDIGYGTIKLPDPVNEVVFCLGVVDPTRLRINASPDQDGVVTLPQTLGTAEAQHLRCSDPTKL